MLWRAAKRAGGTKAQETPAWNHANQATAHAGARWNVFNRNAYHHRREFNPGAPAFAYANQGLPEYPLAAGFNNRYQFLVYQKPFDISPNLGKELIPMFGQSAAMAPMPIGQQLYTPAQLTAFAQIAADGGYLPPAELRDPGIWGAPDVG